MSSLAWWLLFAALAWIGASILVALVIAAFIRRGQQ